MNPWFVASLVVIAVGCGIALWWLVHHGDEPKAPVERPGSDGQFAQWLKPSAASDAAAEGRTPTDPGGGT